MRTFALLPVCLQAVNGEEGSSLLQVGKQVKADSKHSAEPVEESYEAPHVCGEWSAWSTCSKECGGGLETRTYSFIDGVKCGIECPHGDGDKEQRPCNTQDCPVDCEGSWGEYGDCSASCGGGVQKRMFSITKEACHGGAACPRAAGAEEIHACSTEPCEKDCEGHWEDWSECSNGGYGPDGAECGPGGEQNRVFKVTVASTSGGCDCDNKHGDIDTRSCDLPCCPEDCEGSWGDFGKCKQEDGSPAKTGTKEVEGSYGETETFCCGGGTKTKSFSVTKEKVCGGECCDAPDGTEQSETCCETPCPVDCEGDWGPPSDCSAWCGNGTTTKIYSVTQPALHGGKKCPHKDGAQHDDSCFLKECPIDCEGHWGEYDSCSEQCEDAPGQDHPEGSKTRHWVVTKEAKFGGVQCSEIDQCQTVPCGGDPCPEDAECVWEEWGECSADCNQCGTDHYIFRTRKWIQIKAAKNGGKECKNDPPAYEPAEEACDKPCCPVPCKGHWSEYDKCTAKTSVPSGYFCGGGSKTRKFIVTQAAQYGGQECCHTHGEKDSKDCGDRPCEVPCIGHWNEWSDCCASCGGGSMSRSFEITQSAAHGGPNCSHPDGHTEVKTCGNDPCPIDCEGSWSTWTECSQTCTDCQSYGSVGSTTRKFTITVQAAHGGKQCPHPHDEVEEKVCNDKCCPVDCVGSWSEFGSCSSSCGNGVEGRTYLITQPALYGGVECPRCHESTHTRACNLGACPIHCEGQWSAWSHCSAECGGGQKTSWFLVSSHAQNGGEECEHAAYATKKEDCNTHACFSPCRGSFGLWSKCSKPCGGGQKNRTYAVRSPGAGQPAIPCPFADGLVQTDACNTHECPGGYECSGHCD